MAYKSGRVIAEDTNNITKHHAILVVGSAATSSAVVTLYADDGTTGDTVTLRSAVASTVLPIQIKNAGTQTTCTLYGLA